MGCLIAAIGGFVVGGVVGVIGMAALVVSKKEDE